MKVLKKGIRAAVIMLVSTGIVYGKATTNVAVFNHSTGARQLGMADVAVAFADDANALFYNPAGIAQLKKLELNAGYFDNIVDTKDESISVVYPLRRGLIGKRAGLGLGIKAYQGGDIEFISYDETTQTITSKKTLNAEMDYMVGLAYSEELFSHVGKLYAGLMLKGIRSTLVEDYTASAMAVDIGLLYKTPLMGLSLGISSLNNGSEMKFISEGDDLPQRTIVGAGYQFKPMPMVEVKAGIDYISEKNEDGLSNLGVEVLLLKMISVRAGYLTDSDLGSVTAGLGVKIGMIEVNYGYGMMDELNSLQKVSLTVRWDVAEADEEVIKKKTRRTVRKKTLKKKAQRKAPIKKKVKSTKKVIRKTSTKKSSSKKYSLAK